MPGLKAVGLPRKYHPIANYSLFQKGVSLLFSLLSHLGKSPGEWNLRPPPSDGRKALGWGGVTPRVADVSGGSAVGGLVCETKVHLGGV